MKKPKKIIKKKQSHSEKIIKPKTLVIIMCLKMKNKKPFYQSREEKKDFGNAKLMYMLRLKQKVKNIEKMEESIIDNNRKKRKKK